jgi:hypothetical protein
MSKTLPSALLMIVAAVSFALPAAADEPTAPSEAPAPSEPAGHGSAVAPRSTHGLTRIHAGLTSNATSSAGTGQNVELTARAAPTGPAVRLAPSPRVLRRMNTERAMGAVDASVRACASDSAAATPSTFTLRVVVGPGGEVESAAAASPTAVATSVVACVVKAVSAARFGAPGAAGAAIAVPISLPGRAAIAAPAVETAASPAPTPAAEGPVAAK